jgi:RNA polymerase sigma factor (sigma-70 family)
MAPLSAVTRGRAAEPAAELAWSDSRLIDACLKGSQPAWSAVIHRYKSLIFSIAYRYRANREDAEDIFQAVCVELYGSLATLRNTETLRPWLATVTAHAAFDWKKRHQPRALSHVEMDAVNPLLLSDVPPDLLVEAEREQRIREALETISARCRELMRLLFYEQPPVPYKEVAARLGLAVGSLGFIRGRCLSALKKVLDRLDA